MRGATPDDPLPLRRYRRLQQFLYHLRRILPGGIEPGVDRLAESVTARLFPGIRRTDRDLYVEEDGRVLRIPGAFTGAYVTRGYEPLTARVWSGLAERSLRVADVGSHIGYYTVLAGRAMAPGGLVHALEPWPENVDYLRENVALNALEGSAIVHPLAAGAETGRRRLRVTSSSDSHGFYPHPLAGGGPAGEGMEIATARLDELLDCDLDLVKIDVEGAEIEVLEGMSGLWKRSRPFDLVVEWNPSCLRAAGRDPEDLPRILRELGADPVRVLDDRRMEVRTLEEVAAEIAEGGWLPHRYVNLHAAVR